DAAGSAHNKLVIGRGRYRLARARVRPDERTVMHSARMVSRGKTKRPVRHVFRTTSNDAASSGRPVTPAATDGPAVARPVRVAAGHGTGVVAGRVGVAAAHGSPQTARRVAVAAADRVIRADDGGRVTNAAADGGGNTIGRVAGEVRVIPAAAADGSGGAARL